MAACTYGPYTRAGPRLAAATYPQLVSTYSKLVAQAVAVTVSEELSRDRESDYCPGAVPAATARSIEAMIGKGPA